MPGALAIVPEASATEARVVHALVHLELKSSATTVQEAEAELQIVLGVLATLTLVIGTELKTMATLRQALIQQALAMKVLPKRQVAVVWAEQLAPSMATAVRSQATKSPPLAVKLELP